MDIKELKKTKKNFEKEINWVNWANCLKSVASKITNEEYQTLLKGINIVYLEGQIKGLNE